MSMNKEKIIEKINQYTWYHNIDLGNGIVTPGRGWYHLWEPSSKFMEKADIAGKRVLEIGTWDGYFSFKAESLGAENVMATDIKHWETFLLARELLNSKVEFTVSSVYFLDNVLPQASFDVIICYGIYYHLLFPLLGFFKMNQMLRPDGILLLEGPYLQKYEKESIFLFSYGQDRISENDPTFCNCPTLKCLENMLNASLFRVIEIKPYVEETQQFGRVLIMAQKREKTDDDQLYEHTYPNFLLASYS